MSDEIVREVREARAKLAEINEFDIRKMAEYLREQEKRSQLKVVGPDELRKRHRTAQAT